MTITIDTGASYTPDAEAYFTERADRRILIGSALPSKCSASRSPNGRA